MTMKNDEQKTINNGPALTLFELQIAQIVLARFAHARERCRAFAHVDQLDAGVLVQLLRQTLAVQPVQYRRQQVRRQMVEHREWRQRGRGRRIERRAGKGRGAAGPEEPGRGRWLELYPAGRLAGGRRFREVEHVPVAAQVRVRAGRDAARYIEKDRAGDAGGAGTATATTTTQSGLSRAGGETVEGVRYVGHLLGRKVVGVEGRWR